MPMQGCREKVKFCSHSDDRRALAKGLEQLFNQLLQETSKKVVEGLVRVVVLEIKNSDFNGLVVAIFSEFCSGSAHVINSNRA